MSAPDPEGFSLLQKVLTALAAVGLPIWGARTWLENRFSKKADKDEVKRCLEHCERLYQNAEQDRARTRELITAESDKLQQRLDENHRHVVGLILGNRNAP